jgi:C-terminal processing protease CtpA/Prc
MTTEEHAAMRDVRVVTWRTLGVLLLVAALMAVPAAGIRADAADASLVIAALRVLEQDYVDPVDAAQMLNVATAVLRHGTELGTDALPEIPSGTTRARAIAMFTTAFSRAAQTGVADRTTLAYAATAGMLASLRDSHTYFIEPAALREGRRQLSGRPGFSGIGVGIVSREDSAGTRWVFV